MPDEQGQSPLSVAAAASHSKRCVEVLLKKGADVHHKDKLGNTPLHAHACSFVTDLETVELLKAGAKNCPNNLGFTPAILSCSTCILEENELVGQLKSQLDPREFCNCYRLSAAVALLYFWKS